MPRGSRFYDALDQARWQRVRRLALERDGWRCVQCGLRGRLDVDHIVPLRRGGATYDLANLQVLCRACHIEKSRGESRRPPTPAELEWQALARELVSR